MGRMTIVVLVVILLIMGGVGINFAEQAQVPTTALPYNYGACANGQYDYAVNTTTLSCSQVNYRQIGGNVQPNYTSIQNFPAGCSSGQAVTSVTTTLACGSFLSNTTFWFVNSGNKAKANAYYGLSGAFNATNEIPVSVFCPVSGTFTRLAVQITASAGTGAAVIVTFDRNTIAQNLVATCTNPATTCVDLTHSVSCAGGANNYVDYMLTETGTVVGGLYVSISVLFTEDGM